MVSFSEKCICSGRSVKKQNRTDDTEIMHNFIDLIEKIEEKQKEVGEIEIWSALFIYGGETSQIKMKVYETLKARKK